MDCVRNNYKKQIFCDDILEFICEFVISVREAYYGFSLGLWISAEKHTVLF